MPFGGAVARSCLVRCEEAFPVVRAAGGPALRKSGRNRPSGVSRGGRSSFPRMARRRFRSGTAYPGGRRTLPAGIGRAGVRERGGRHIERYDGKTSSRAFPAGNIRARSARLYVRRLVEGFRLGRLFARIRLACPFRRDGPSGGQRHGSVAARRRGAPVGHLSGRAVRLYGGRPGARGQCRAVHGPLRRGRRHGHRERGRDHLYGALVVRQRDRSGGRERRRRARSADLRRADGPDRLSDRYVPASGFGR